MSTSLCAVDLRMGGIWLKSHDLLEFLLEIQLPSAHVVFEDESAVLLSGLVCMNLDMGVNSSFDVRSYCRVSICLNMRSLDRTLV
jgi:hypothetical protein